MMRIVEWGLELSSRVKSLVEEIKKLLTTSMMQRGMHQEYLVPRCNFGAAL